MLGEPWQIRLRELGISQAAFARAVDLTPSNMSEGLRGTWKYGVPHHIKVAIIALEIMMDRDKTGAMAAEWLEKATAERDASLELKRRARQKP